MNLQEYLEEARDYKFTDAEDNSATGEHYPAASAKKRCEEFIDEIDDWYVKNVREGKKGEKQFLFFIKNRLGRLNDAINSMLGTEMSRFEPDKKWDEYHWKRMMGKKNEKPFWMRGDNRALDKKEGDPRELARQLEADKKLLNKLRQSKKKQWDEKQLGNEMWD